ncbi:MAG: hypothetical protein L0H73_12755 [Nitrococcus sp.]|nr:hypothetical protein [Nitrococcus sp.]
MAHIVGVWELGSQLGHLARFATLASRLRESGHRVSLVLRDLSRVGQLPTLARVPVFQAPIWLPRARYASSQPRSIAEILWHYGYLSAPGLHSMASAWRALFDLLKPDLVLYDYAPTALLGSQGLGFRRATIGVGFCMPPAVSPMLPLQAVDEGGRQKLAATEERVLATINRVLPKFGQPALASLGQLFDADEAFLCTVPELDHYPRRAGTRYWGLVSEGTRGVAPVWPSADRPRVFAYLKPSGPHFQTALDAVVEAGCQAAVFAPGVSRAQAARYRSSAVQISRLPFDIEQAAATADAAVCHAGHDTVLACLLAGTPSLLIAQQMEQFGVASRIEQHGAGVLLRPSAPSQPAEQLRWLLTEPGVRKAAQDMAARHTAAKPPRSVHALVARCNELIAGV